MPHHSKVVDHPARAAIEQSLARGAPIPPLARKYKLHPDVLYRYRAAMPAALRAAGVASKLKANVDLDQLRIDESEGILTNLALQRARLLRAQDAAIEAGDGRQVAFISDVIMRSVRLTGTYLGEFSKHVVQTNINLMVSDSYLEMRAALMRALSRFPDARRAVAEALQQIEAKAAEPAKAMPPMIEGTAQEVSASA
jgi:hypothetical protein